jgi:hypothetical protein
MCVAVTDIASEFGTDRRGACDSAGPQPTGGTKGHINKEWVLRFAAMRSSSRRSGFAAGAIFGAVAILIKFAEDISGIANYLVIGVVLLSLTFLSDLAARRGGSALAAASGCAAVFTPLAMVWSLRYRDGVQLFFESGVGRFVWPLLRFLNPRRPAPAP